MPTSPLVCLITPGHLASTPRLLKEADALLEAGYRVHVVAGRHYPPAEPLDAGVLQTARWACTRVDFRHGPGGYYRKCLRLLARRLIPWPGVNSVRLAARAHHAASLRLAAIAATIPADLYLGHCLAGLPAAALAARRNRVRYGFDVEDYHDGETVAGMRSRAESAAGRILQHRLLPGCVHLTAAAPLIAEALRQRYGVTSQVVLNVFPRVQAPPAPFDPGPVTASRPARLYWFSQTVGPGRGLEAVMAALQLMHTPTTLQLRGFVAPDYAAQLRRRATDAGGRHSLDFLPPGPVCEMSRLAASADLGLATEEPPPPNRDLCLTNKIFVYLLAGIPQLLSNTSAQRGLAPALGAAALLADLTQPEQLAQQLDAFFADPARMRTSRQTAWRLAQERYCWDVEQEKFLASIRIALS